MQGRSDGPCIPNKRVIMLLQLLRSLQRVQGCAHVQRPTIPSLQQQGKPCSLARMQPAQHQPSHHRILKPSRLTTTCQGLLAGTDVVSDYTQALTEEIHDLAEELKDFRPEKADEVLSKEEQRQLTDYINRSTDLLLLEVDAEVQEFVACLKDWPLKWLQDDGRVLLELSAVPAGTYFNQEAVRFYMPASGGNNKKKHKFGASFSTSDDDEEWMDLPRHSLAPGDMVLVTSGKKGPLANGDWVDDMLCGVVIERSKTWVKVAFETAPDKYELESETWRLDKSVNTLTVKRAMLALASLWHCMPLEEETWLQRSLKALPGPSKSLFGDDKPSLKDEVEGFYSDLDEDSPGQPRQHNGIFVGSALSGVILKADKGFDWDNLPATAGGMTSDAITRFRQILPAAGRPDESATAALLRRMEQQGQLGSSRGLRLDASQMQAVATAVLNPLALLHGPPGTGKTTTIGALLVFLRKQHGYKGRILAAAQSNVAVDNMLETALRLGLRVLRIGEPAKVRSCLQSLTLKAQLAQAVSQDPAIMEARAEQQSLRRRLRQSRKRKGEYLAGWERREIFERLDELRAETDSATKKTCSHLLDAADVVGVTCTGAAGPELAGFAFDLVVIDEGSQASEPEALIPIMKGSQRVVLVGDHKQLPPVIKSREAEEGGLGKSLFERLMHLGAPSAMLQVQYRSHPSLMEFINEQYYHGLLSNGVSAAARPGPPGFPFPNPSVPVIFIQVDGKETSSARGSKMNSEEAAVVEDCVKVLVERCGLQPGQLGVITPYAAQVSLLSKGLQQRGFSINGSGGSSWDSMDDAFVSSDLEVKSVDGYQGREKDVILLSTVRANSNQEVGFLEDWRRANVALSRARAALVVVGHKSTLRGSKTWGAFLRHVDDRGCLVKLNQLQGVLASAARPRSNGRRC